MNYIFNFEYKISMAVGLPDFREEQVENRVKNRKMLNFESFEGGFYPFVLE